MSTKIINFWDPEKYKIFRGGADNQQERLNNSWVVGFVDGEGCFHVAINRQHAMKIGWQALPEFRIVQHKSDLQILERLQAFFGCGIIGKNHDDRMELRIRGIENLLKIVSFFKDNPLCTKKGGSFEKFAEILSLMKNGAHLNKEGLDKIALLAWQMNRKVKPRYLESSETICRTP